MGEDTLEKVQTLRPLLRGVKITGFLLAVLSVASVASLQQSRPVGAESFLFNTVQCILGSLLDTTCPQPTSAQLTTSSSSAPSSQSSSSRSSSPGQSSQGASGNNGNGGSGKGSPVTRTAPQAATNTDSFATPPIAPQSGALNSYAALPDSLFATSDLAQQYQGSPQQVFPYGVRSAVSTDAGQSSFVKASREGWLVMGVAWYWWLLGIAAVGIASWRVVKVVRHRRSKILLYS